MNQRLTTNSICLGVAVLALALAGATGCEVGDPEEELSEDELADDSYGYVPDGPADFYCEVCGADSCDTRVSYASSNSSGIRKCQRKVNHVAQEHCEDVGNDEHFETHYYVTRYELDSSGYWRLHDDNVHWKCVDGGAQYY